MDREWQHYLELKAGSLLPQMKGKTKHENSKITPPFPLWEQYVANQQTCINNDVVDENESTFSFEGLTTKANTLQPGQPLAGLLPSSDAWKKYVNTHNAFMNEAFQVEDGKGSNDMQIPLSRGVLIPAVNGKVGPDQHTSRSRSEAPKKLIKKRIASKNEQVKVENKKRSNNMQIPSSRGVLIPAVNGKVRPDQHTNPSRSEALKQCIKPQCARKPTYVPIGLEPYTHSEVLDGTTHIDLFNANTKSKDVKYLTGLYYLHRVEFVPTTSFSRCKETDKMLSFAGNKCVRTRTDSKYTLDFSILNPVSLQWMYYIAEDKKGKQRENVIRHAPLQITAPTKNSVTTTFYYSLLKVELESELGSDSDDCYSQMTEIVAINAKKESDKVGRESLQSPSYGIGNSERPIFSGVAADVLNTSHLDENPTDDESPTEGVSSGVASDVVQTQDANEGESGYESETEGVSSGVASDVVQTQDANEGESGYESATEGVSSGVDDSTKSHAVGHGGGLGLSNAAEHPPTISAVVVSHAETDNTTSLIQEEDNNETNYTNTNMGDAFPSELPTAKPSQTQSRNLENTEEIEDEEIEEGKTKKVEIEEGKTKKVETEKVKPEDVQTEKVKPEEGKLEDVQTNTRYLLRSKNATVLVNTATETVLNV